MEKVQKKILTLNAEEYGVVVNSLNDKRNDLLKEQKPTDAVDNLILKTIDAPSRKVKCRCDEAR